MPPLKDFRHRRSPEPFRISVGARLRDIRKALNLTQRDVAALSGLRPDRLAKYEGGTHPPTVFALTRIAETLSRPVDFLLPELHLSNEVDRNLYSICRRLWLYPEEFRANCVGILRHFLASADLAELRSAQREGHSHAASRR